MARMSAGITTPDLFNGRHFHREIIVLYVRWFLLSERRDLAPAKRFFGKPIKHHGEPRVITLDAYSALHVVPSRKRNQRER
jgi:hypothetical protein